MIDTSIRKELNIQILKVEGFNYFNDSTEKEFIKFYQNFFTNSIAHLHEEFIKKSKELFSDFDPKKITPLSDEYFNNFTVAHVNLLIQGRPQDALAMWVHVINTTVEWERQNGISLHKGTPYYFGAEAAMMGSDIDTTFVMMSMAQREDETNLKKKDTPANYFLKLDGSKFDQYLKQHVTWIEGFFRDRFDGNGNEGGRYKDHYVSKQKTNFSWDDFRNGFYEMGDVKEGLKHFVSFSIARIANIRRAHKNDKIRGDLISSLVFCQALGGIFVAIEGLLRGKYGNKDRENLGSFLQALFKDNAWTQDKLDTVKEERKTDFSKWILSCLDGDIRDDFCLLLGLRNYTLHDIESQIVLWRELTKVLQSILNCLFFVVETRQLDMNQR